MGKPKAPKKQKGDTPEMTAQKLEDKIRAQELFLQAYMTSGRVDLATKEAGVCYQWPYYWAREEGSDFKQRWDEAREVAAQVLEDAAQRRAVVGVRRPIYQRGMLVGFERHYSDTLLSLLLKANKPEKYRERVSLESTGKDGGPIETKTTLGLTDETAEVMRQKILGIVPKKEDPK